MASTVQTIEKLEESLAKLDSFESSAIVERNGELKSVVLAQFQGFYVRWKEPYEDGLGTSRSVKCKSLSEALTELLSRFGDALIYPESVMIDRALIYPGGGKPTIEVMLDGDYHQYCQDLYRLVQRCWCETIANVQSEDFGTSTPEDFRSALIPAKLLKHLQNGAAGIQKWNHLHSIDYSVFTMGGWERCQLAGKALQKAELSGMRFSNSNFDDANLDGAQLMASKIDGATFRGANMNKCSLESGWMDNNQTEAMGANFTGASMKQCNLQRVKLNFCDFTDADLTKADLRKSLLQGADLSTAKLTDARLEEAEYNELTKLPPPPFSQWSSLCWQGSGEDPLKQMMRAALAQSGCKTFDEFKEHVSTNFDGARVTNALKMLKKERFQLYAQVEKTHVVGIVKSQTDPDLIYACTLTSAGEFFCGTQNLKPCGGLKGALCKHILVLTIGLARSDQLDLTDGANWIINSENKKPVMHKDLMTTVFLRYKGMQANELDWRPTETIPEDYYT